MITDMISTAPGFQTSVNISYDLNNSEKIKSLIPTSTAVSLFEDFLLSTDNSATNRAKILIGAYGKGKSHIILSILSFLCRKVENDNAALLAKVETANKELYAYSSQAEIYILRITIASKIYADVLRFFYHLSQSSACHAVINEHGFRAMEMEIL